MSVQNEENYRQYAGDGITTTFSVTYPFQLNSWLVVKLYNTSTGVYTTLVLNTDYTVTGAGNPSGGIVTTIVAPAVGTTIIIERTGIPITQLTVYTENDPFPAKSHENALDKLTMLLQQINLIAGSRALRFPENESNNPILAAAILRAYKYFYFNGAGNIVYTPNTPDTYLAFDSAGIPTFLPVITGTPPDTFLQEGIGAVARNFQSKVREIFSVRDFGALGNGVDNDTTAIQAAIDALSNTAAGGGILYFPPGNYLVDTLTLESNIIYAGAGVATILTLAVTSTGDALFSGTSLENIQIKDFNIVASIGLSLDLEVDGMIINQCTLEGDITINGDEVKIESTSLADNVIFKGNDFLINDCSLTKQLIFAVNDVADVLTNIKVFNNQFDGADAGITLDFGIATTEKLEGYHFEHNTFKDCDWSFTLLSTTGELAYNQNINICKNNIIDSGIMNTNNASTFYIRGLNFINNNCYGELGQFIIGQHTSANIRILRMMDNTFDHLGDLLSDLIIFKCISNEVTIKNNLFSGASGISNLGNAITLDQGNTDFFFIEDNEFYNCEQTVKVNSFTVAGNTCRYQNNSVINASNDHNFPAWYTDDIGSTTDTFLISTGPDQFVLGGIANTLITTGTGPEGNTGSLSTYAQIGRDISQSFGGPQVFYQRVGLTGNPGWTTGWFKYTGVAV